MSDEKIPDFPEEDKRSLPYHAAKIGLGAADLVVPGLGYALQVAADKFIGDPLEKRRDEWRKQIVLELGRLAEKIDGFSIEEISQREEFIDCVYATTDIYLKNRTEEKRLMLLNCISNVAFGSLLDAILRNRFLSYIDQFSPMHIRVLRVVANPSGYERARVKAQSMYAGAPRVAYRAEITEAELPDTEFDIIVEDLKANRLIRGNLTTGMTGEAILAPLTTPEGNAFLRFISDPVT